MQLTSPRQNNAYRPIIILDHVFFCGRYGHLRNHCPDRAATSSTGSNPYNANSTVNDDRIGDNQLSNLPPDKCDLFLSSNRAIIKQKNFSSEGVQGRLKLNLFTVLARNAPMPTVCA